MRGCMHSGAAPVQPFRYAAVYAVVWRNEYHAQHITMLSL